MIVPAQGPSTPLLTKEGQQYNAPPFVHSEEPLFEMISAPLCFLKVAKSENTVPACAGSLRIEIAEVMATLARMATKSAKSALRNMVGFDVSNSKEWARSFQHEGLRIRES